MLGVGIILIFVVVMLFSLVRSAGMADRKFEELQWIEAMKESNGLDKKRKEADEQIRKGSDQVIKVT